MDERAMARQLAAAYLDRVLRLPSDRAPAEIALTSFDSEEALRIAKPDEPDMTLSMQRALNSAMIELAEQKGIRCRVRHFDVERYLKWLAIPHLGGGANTAEARARFIARQDRIERIAGRRQPTGQRTGQPYRLSLVLGCNSGGGRGHDAYLGWAVLDLGHRGERESSGTVTVAGISDTR